MMEDRLRGMMIAAPPDGTISVQIQRLRVEIDDFGARIERWENFQEVQMISSSNGTSLWSANTNSEETVNGTQEGR